MPDANAITEQFNFLSVLSQGCPEGLRFIVAKKHTWTDTDTGKTRLGFPTEAWREQYLDGPWYFSTGASDLARSRKRQNLKALRAIVIDDIGTKVDADKVLAAPTWVLETSPGNFQWGYLLKEWTDDIHGGDELFAGLVAAGLQDPGVRTCCRLFRLPDSVNDKPEAKGFRSVLHSFDADIVYTLSSLAKALKVKPGKIEKPPAERPALDIDPQEFPDAVFDWLGEQGMINHEGTNGWWDIVCPFDSEHTHGNESGTRYRPRWAAPDGCSGVMCHHGHGGISGAEYRRRFIEWLGEQGAPEWPLPARKTMTSYQDILRKLLPPPPPPKTPQPRHDPEPEPGRREPYNINTLREALGGIALTALPDLELSEKGVVMKRQMTTNANIEGGLNYLGVQPRLNLMNGTTSYTLPDRVDPNGFGDMTERAISELVTDTLVDIFNVARQTNDTKLEQGFDNIASRNRWHPMRDWILSTPWDGKDRFEALAATLPTPDPKLFKVYFRRWLLQGVEAACGWAIGRESQKGLVLVLVGAQRIGKTRWLMALAPDFSKASRHLNLNGHNARDSKHEALQGVIVELGELDGTFRKTDIAALKAFLTETIDEYRLPYGKRWGSRPRCTSFCGSVNEHRFLNDPTGSGRFLPVEVDGAPQVDHAIDMQQLWAQMYSEWARGEPWYLTRAEEKLRDAAADQFQALDEVAERIAETLAEREDREAFPVEAIIGPGALCELCEVDPLHPRNVGTAGRLLQEHLGKGRDLRPYGAGTTKPRWAIGVTQPEVNRLKLKVSTKPVRRA